MQYISQIPFFISTFRHQKSIKRKQKMKQIKLVLLLFIVIGFTNCNKKDDPIIEETPDVVINELLPKNTLFKTSKATSANRSGFLINLFLLS